VEEQEQERDLHAFVCEPVGIAAAIALEKGMTFQLAEVVAELIQSVGFGGTPRTWCLRILPTTLITRARPIAR
jgi:hypothetical protein